MITESMTLNSKSDATVWAEQLGLSTAEQAVNVINYIWRNKPAVGCTYAEHPISKLSDEQFWNIADEA